MEEVTDGVEGFFCAGTAGSDGVQDGNELDGGVFDGCRRGREGSRQRVGTVAADGRQDFGRNPSAEFLGLWLAAPKDQGVKAGLADDDGFLWASGGVNNTHPLFILFQGFNGSGRLLDFEHLADIGSDEPRLALAVGDSDGFPSEVEGLEAGSWFRSGEHGGCVARNSV